MKRKQLEIRINDAADGLLSKPELEKLESDLQQEPELLMEYREIMALPDFSGIYGSQDDYRDQRGVSAILDQITNRRREEIPFEAATIHWFRKYALAASLLILAGTSLIYFTDTPATGYEEALTADQLLYPEDTGLTEDYVLYINDWFEQTDE